MDYKIRVFISYTNKDKKLTERLASILKNAGLEPLWARDLPVGIGFDEQIKNLIEHSHIIMPILSEPFSVWVQQEIGYALALNIPVYPVTFENISPGGFLQRIQAHKLIDDDDYLEQTPWKRDATNLLSNRSPVAHYLRASVVQERATMLREYANRLREINQFGIVRQMGGLSSFHIPNEYTNHRVWIDRYFPETRSRNHKQLQREERIALQAHAIEEGCKLIITPSYAIKDRSEIAAKTRLSTLIKFLTSMTDQNCQVAMRAEQSNVESLTIVGDWYLAESVSFIQGDGFTNTFFTRNATEIANRIADFDAEFDDLLKQSGWSEKTSRRDAIELLTEISKSVG